MYFSKTLLHHPSGRSDDGVRMNGDEGPSGGRGQFFGNAFGGNGYGVSGASGGYNRVMYSI